MMYHVKATNTTPEVLLDLEKNEFLIEGRSLPEEGVIFYETIIDWLKEHLPDEHIKASFDVKLQYCNTSSYKGLQLLFKALERLNERSHSFSVNWYYDKEDEDWLEDGETYSEFVNVPFKFLENR